MFARLPIREFEGLYSITPTGEVWSHITCKVLKPWSNDKSGHLYVRLTRDGTHCSRAVHHLVLETFVGPRPAGMKALHNDGDAENNAVTNLRWGTDSDNQFDAVEHGTHHNRSKVECPQGHLYNEGNTYVRANGRNGERRCRQCNRDRNRNRRANA